MPEKILITIVAAIVIWVLKFISTYLVRGSRLRAALISDINLHIDGAREQIDAVRRLFKEVAQSGQKIPFPISYNVAEYSFYRSIQCELFIYLKQNEITKVIKFYQAIWELDISINGLATTLGVWERDNHELTENDIKHIRKRKDRIESFIEVVASKNINSISELPEDYKQVKGPETVVEET